MGARAELTRALLAGRAAARAGQSITTCPHDSRTLLRTAWLRGYGQEAGSTQADMIALP
ncbi:Rmf/CrpP fold protein [Streptomyces sp. NPDC059913]|uniref:Rmf/CrpP fold protein n=1 Tax=unclassified Streptomyces TaxID=2593676 RepID=UPI00364CF020